MYFTVASASGICQLSRLSMLGMITARRLKAGHHSPGAPSEVSAPHTASTDRGPAQLAVAASMRIAPVMSWKMRSARTWCEGCSRSQANAAMRSNNASPSRSRLAF